MAGLLINIVLTAVLTLYAASAVAAQNNNPDSSVILADLYTGIESAAGTCEMMFTATCYGNTFVLNSFGKAETRHLTVSLNYFNSLPNGGNGFAILGGTWSLVVIRDGQYVGTIYGDVKDGSIVFPQNENEPSAKITTATLRITGGLGSFETRRRKKTSVTLNLSTHLTSRQTTGHLDLTSR